MGPAPAAFGRLSAAAAVAAPGACSDCDRALLLRPQDAPEHESQSRHKRTTYAADAKWSAQALNPEERRAVKVEPKLEAVVGELASEEEAHGAAHEKSIYDDWDEDEIAL